MLKKPIWNAIETTLFYYSGGMCSWSSLMWIWQLKIETSKLKKKHRKHYWKQIEKNNWNNNWPVLVNDKSASVVVWKFIFWNLPLWVTWLKARQLNAYHMSTLKFEQFFSRKWPEKFPSLFSGPFFPISYLDGQMLERPRNINVIQSGFGKSFWTHYRGFLRC